MGRLIQYRVPPPQEGDARAQSEEKKPSLGEKTAELLKRIPGEVVALYVAADSCLKTRIEAHPRQTTYLYSLIVLLGLVGLFMYYRKLAKTENAPFAYNFGLGVFAYAVWLYITADGGLARAWPFPQGAFDGTLVPFVLLVYGFIVAVIPPPTKPA